MVEYPEGANSSFMQAPQQTAKACLKFLFNMIDDSEIAQPYYYLFG
jgi:hypothetical protein